MSNPRDNPENYFEVRKALKQAGRTDLIGTGCDALIPAQPPTEALRARREQANRNVRSDYVYTVPNPSANRGYRPGRKNGAAAANRGRKNISRRAAIIRTSVAHERARFAKL